LARALSRRPREQRGDSTLREFAMTDKKRVVPSSLLLGLIGLSLSGCVVEPREGYYDRDHHRYYHEHRWRECGDRDWDDHCRR
jgi:hypothetical protein